jgi:hypothetical protein
VAAKIGDLKWLIKRKREYLQNNRVKIIAEKFVAN